MTPHTNILCVWQHFDHTWKFSTFVFGVRGGGAHLGGGVCFFFWCEEKNAHLVLGGLPLWLRVMLTLGVPG